MDVMGTAWKDVTVRSVFDRFKFIHEDMKEEAVAEYDSIAYDVTYEHSIA